jgi:small-conductance mechanosensitive channel
MDLIDQGILEAGAGLLSQIEVFLRSLLLRWRLYQVGILVALFGLAHLLALWMRGRLEGWVRHRTGLPRWRLRVAVVVSNRMRGLIFVLLAWSVYAAMQQVTWPSRSTLIGLWATIATAWVAVGLAAQFIRNRPVRRIVMWLAWIYIALYFLGFLDGAAVFLDSVAIEFADFRLSALSVLKGLLVTAALLFVARVVSQALIRRIQGNDEISPSMRVLSVKAIQFLFIGLAIVIGLRAVGFDMTGLAVLSGAIGLGIGFGLQKVVSNLVCGIIILLDKSVKPGDVISLGDTFGWINELGARYVSVVTRDGREYLIPNEDLVTGQVVNWSHTDDFVRIDLNFGTSYLDDPHKVRAVAVEAARRVPRVLEARSVVCHITGFGESSVNYVLRFWIRDPRDGLQGVRGPVFLALWDAFQEHGITIPFPQREMRVLNTPLAVEMPAADARREAQNPPPSD